MNEQPVRAWRRLRAGAFAGRLAVAGAVLLGAMHSRGDDLGRMPRPDEVLPGRATPVALPWRHHVFDAPLDVAPAGTERAVFGMGCFWGAEEHFFHLPGVVSTAVGYAGGATPNPSYEEVCSGRTGHAEVVRVTFDPRRVSYARLLQVFWEGHDPTQGFRQGNDRGTQYRSTIYTSSPEQLRVAQASRDAYAAALHAAGRGNVTTEIRPAPEFYFAESYHQQYCAVNPHGYCGHGGTGVSYPR